MNMHEGEGRLMSGCWLMNTHEALKAVCLKVMAKHRSSQDQGEGCSRVKAATCYFNPMLFDDASHSVLIENNGVAPDWASYLFSSDSIVFNENRIASVIAELLQRWR